MSDLTNNIGATAEVVTRVIQFITNGIGNFGSKIGILEIVVIIVIGFIVYLFFNQHMLPQKVYKP
jgi:hypothetical protein